MNASVPSASVRELPRGSYESDFRIVVESWKQDALAVLQRRFRYLLHQTQRNRQKEALEVCRDRLTYLDLSDRLHVAMEAGRDWERKLQEERSSIEEEIVLAARERHCALDRWLAERN